MEIGEVKVLVIGDPHIKKSNIPEIDEMIGCILKVAEETRPDFIVNLGDTLDQHEIVHTTPLNKAVEFIHKLSQIAPTYVIIGNHDLQSNNGCFLTGDHAFNALKFIPKVTIVDTPILVDVKDKRFIMCPYVYPGKLNEALMKIEKKRENITAYFLHQELRGCNIGIIKSVIGDLWDLSYPLVISGHIHEYHRPQRNIVYVGTPIQHGFGDDHKKSISLFTFTKDWEEKRIYLNVTRKMIVRLSPSQLNTYVPEEKALIKVVVTGTSAEIKVMSKADSVMKLRERGIKVTFKISEEVGSEMKSDEKRDMGTGRSRFIDILQSMILNDGKKRELLSRLLIQ